MKSDSIYGYEIVSLCDIKRFNKKIGTLKNVPWTQINVPETLSLPKEKPPIKSIYKIYINVEAISLKIIETPKMAVYNAEGIILTGKKLLVNGYIYQKIIYNSTIASKSLNSVEFKIPFYSYIIINGDSDIYNDTFTIKSCIEDVFATPLSKNMIFQNTTIFLFADKNIANKKPPKPEPPILYETYNGIIIYNENNIEVANIKFDLQTKTIVVESTGAIPNQNLEAQEYFSLILRTVDNFIEKISILETNKDASDLYSDFNNVKFDFDENIELKYLDNTGIIITNLPTKTQSFNPNSEEGNRGIQRFSITEKGLISIK